MAQNTTPFRPPSDAFDERRLLEAVRQGDRSAAEEIAARTYQRVFSTLVRLAGGNVDLAADLTQETYRRAWKALARFEGRAKLSTWLHRIAYTTFLNHVRNRKKIVPLDPEYAEQIPSEAPSQEEKASTHDEHERLRRAVLALDDDLRYPLTARYWGDVSVQEIATEIGITPAAVRKRLKKAQSQLALLLQTEPLQEETR